MTGPARSGPRSCCRSSRWCSTSWTATSHGSTSAGNRRLGADLDSLADIVSFGVAPAVLGYTLGLRGLWDVVVLTFFVCSGISRLARFNVTSASLTNAATGKVRYFEGTPIPTSILLVILMAVLYHLGLTGQQFWWGHWTVLGRGFHPIAILFLVSGSLMVSTVKVPKP